VSLFCFFSQVQLKLVSMFSYGPGCVCIFFSSELYHKVSNFQPLQQTKEQKDKNITPGRIGTVMFFPKASFEILKGKPEGWARKTDYGAR